MTTRARDPIEAAFSEYRRASRDDVLRTVEHTVEHTVEDLRRLADGSAQVTITHSAPTASHGTATQVTITTPFTRQGKEIR